MSVGVDIERDVVLGRVGTVLVDLRCFVRHVGVFGRCVLRILLLLLRQVGFVLHRRIRATADEREEHHEREQPCGQLFLHWESSCGDFLHHSTAAGKNPARAAVDFTRRCAYDRGNDRQVGMDQKAKEIETMTIEERAELAVETFAAGKGQLHPVGAVCVGG